MEWRGKQQFIKVSICIACRMPFVHIIKRKDRLASANVTVRSALGPVNAFILFALTRA